MEILGCLLDCGVPKTLIWKYHQLDLAKLALRTGGDTHHSAHCGELEGERMWDLIQVFQGILEGLVRRIQHVYWKDTVGDSKIYYHQSQKMCKKILGGSNRNDQWINSRNFGLKWLILIYDIILIWKIIWIYKI